MSQVLEQLQLAINDDLERIAARFKPGVKLTLVVRHTIVEGDAGCVFTDDDLDEAIKEIRRRKAQDTAAAPRRCKAPTSPMAQTLAFMREYVVEHGYPPTVAEIQERLSVRSSNTIYQRLLALRRRGLVVHTPNVARGWRPA